MNKMLMIIDPQVDFINGSLPVPGAAEAMNHLADYVDTHANDYACIIVTGDSHPADHCSFSPQGGQWPVHCVAGSEGEKVWASLDASLQKTAPEVFKMIKGDKSDREEYSIFRNPVAKAKIMDIIENKGITHIDICGLAGDVCVAQSMADGREIFGDDFFTLLPQFSPTIA